MLVVPTVVCSAVVTERIAAAVDGAVALPHLAGCGQLGPDMQVTHDTLAAYCQHPNVGAVLVVALGCEQVVAQMLAESARAAGKPAAIVSIQGEGRHAAGHRQRHAIWPQASPTTLSRRSASGATSIA